MSQHEEAKEEIVEYGAEKDERSESGEGLDDYQYSHPPFRKLLSWGVETRGALTLSSLQQAPMLTVDRLCANSHLARPSGAANEHPLQPDLLHLVFGELQHSFVRNEVASLMYATF